MFINGTTSNHILLHCANKAPSIVCPPGAGNGGRSYKVDGYSREWVTWSDTAVNVQILREKFSMASVVNEER